MKKEFKFGGFGGQGIVLAGYIFGKAASIYGGLEASMSQSYGPEARGGACSSSVVVSDSSVDYPFVDEPDVLVVMSQEAYYSYKDQLRRGGVLIYDPDMVKIDDPPKGIEMYACPATKMAEELGKKIVANIVMLGFVTGMVNVLDRESVMEAVLTSVPPAFVELNEKAFNMGYEYSQQVKK